jgi:nucleoid DNA-binding protein
MDKRDLVRAVAATSGKPMTTVDVILDAAFQKITEALERGEIVSIGGFGSFALGSKPSVKRKKQGS